MPADPVPDTPGRPPAPTRTRRGGDAALVMGTVVALLYLLQLVDSLTGESLLRFGIRPRTVGDLGDILSAPFIHLSWGHLLANTVPLFVLGFFVALGGIGRWAAATAIIVVVGGVGVWVSAPADSVTVGASGVIFGYFGYLIARGLIERRPSDLVVGLVVGALYWSILAGLVPDHQRVSWQGHLFGLLGGVLAAWVLGTGRLRRAARGGPGGPVAGVP